LRCADWKFHYGGICAVRGVDLDVAAGEKVALIGANGAGKTSTLKAIARMLPARGSVKLAGEAIEHAPPHTLVRKGFALVPEGRGVFARLSVLENLEMGAYVRDDKAQILRPTSNAYSACCPRLKERARPDSRARMSGGEQQMLAMGRALMSQPKLLLLDEPSMGLSPIMVDKIFEVVRDVYAQGVTIVLVEQNASRALAVANRAYVMESGLITMSGDARKMLTDPKVRAAYLGE
jgi:branched-chain amino acid transport system ATP-binding protein